MSPASVRVVGSKSAFFDLPVREFEASAKMRGINAFE